MNLKTGHWVLIALTGAIVVLLFLAPHKPSEPTELAQTEDLNEPPTVENDIDSALAIINSEAPMQGILLLRSIAEEHPENFRAQYHMGKFSAQTGQWEKVISRFEIVQSIVPEFKESNYWLGLAHFQMGKIELAKKQLEAFVSSGEDNEQLQNDAARMLNQIIKENAER